MADAMASGVESTWPRQKILSASSMTQIDVSFSDTSRPTYCLLWDMVSLLWRCGEASLYRQWLPRDYAMSRPPDLAAAARSACQGWPRLRGHPQGLGLDWPEHGGMLIGSGLQALATSGKFKPVALSQIRTAGNTARAAKSQAVISCRRLVN